MQREQGTCRREAGELERRGVNVNRRNTAEYMRVYDRKSNGTVRMQGEEVAKVDDLKYLGSTVGEGGGIAAYRGMSAHPIIGGSA